MKKFKLLLVISVLFLLANSTNACPPGYISVCGQLEIMPDGRTVSFVCGNGGNLECCYQCPQM